MRRSIRLLGVLALTAGALVSTVPPAPAGPLPHRFPVVLAPRVGDLALAELSFPHAHGSAVSGRSLRISVPRARGDDYIAATTPAGARGGSRLALVLVASRATKIMIPSSLRLAVAASKALGPVWIRRFTDPLSDRRDGPGWLCGMARAGAAPIMRSLMSSGTPIAGYDPAGAITQAFDISCGLASSPAFEAALRQGAHEEPCAASSCAPEPEPVPVPAPPKCSPCNPQPGQACPLTAVAAVCVAGKDERPPGTAY